MYPIIRCSLKGSIGVHRDVWGLGFRVQVPNKGKVYRDQGLRN